VRRSNSNGKRNQSDEKGFRGSQNSIVPTEKRSGYANAASPDIALILKHFNRRIERSAASGEDKRLYLRVGDEVNHLRYEEWGIGGTCLARVRFQDGQLRCFNNDLDNDACCYYFGVRRYWNPSHGVDAIRSRFFLRG